MRRLFALLLFFALALAQVPPAWLGLRLEEKDGALVYTGDGLRFYYLPGVGWGPPLPPDLPPPGPKGALSYAVLKAVGWTRVLPARARLAEYPERVRLVLDLPGEAALPPRAIREGPFALFLPYFVENPPDKPYLRYRYRPEGTTVTYEPPKDRFPFLFAFYLDAPPRYVLDLYRREPPTTRVLRPGFRLKTRYLFAPYPIRVTVLEADPGAYRLKTVGTPGVRAGLKEMAPLALGLINGGYFDPKTATPIGLWVKGGVTLSLPYGRHAILWETPPPFVAKPRFKAFVVVGGRRYRVGLNATPGRVTAYTVPPVVGRPGEEVLLFKGGRLWRRAPAPAERPADTWAIAYPLGLAPFAHLALGTPARLAVELSPPVSEGLEAGPLLVDRGRLAYDPAADAFDPKAIQLTKVTYQAAVAWTREGGLWFLVSEKTTAKKLAEGLAALPEVWGALRLDSGGSAQLWVEGRLVYPTRARAVVNGLALYPR